MWEERMKMILNEYRLLPFQKEAQELVAKHMEEFFFGESAALPPGYVPRAGEVDAGLQPRRHRSATSATSVTPPESGRSIRNCSCACAVRSAASTSAGVAARAKMNPR